MSRRDPKAAAEPLRNRPQNLGIALADDATRVDALAKVTGRAKYGRDVYPPNVLFAQFVRCPFGSATLLGRDEDAARAVPGVVEVTIERDAGSYHGQPIGHVLAETPQALHRAIAALACRWETQAFVREIEDAVTDAPAAKPETETLLSGADHVIEAVYSTPVQIHAPLETHGAVVEHRGDSATAWVSTQGTFAARDGLGRALGLEESKYEVICEYVGGGFGSKLNGAGREGTTAAQLSAKHQRPIWLFLDREADQVDAGNRPSSRTWARLGVAKDGTIVGGRIYTAGGVGVSRGGGGVSIPSGRYAFGAIDRGHEDVRTAGGAPRAFRAPGHPQAAFAEELLLDEIAHALRRDPIDLRRQLGTDDERSRMLEHAAKIIGWDRRQANGAQTGSLRRGFGAGTASWGRFPAGSEAEVAINRDGTVEVRTGTQDIGTGQRTMAAIVAADALGVPLEVVSVSIGRSSLPVGPGSGGSVTTTNTAPSIREAGEDAKRKLLERFAEATNRDLAALDVVAGEVREHGKTVASFREACSRVGAERLVGRGTWNMQKMRAQGQGSGSSSGAQLVELVVDCETGLIRIERIVAVQACGQVVCRKTAESQIIGGVIQGLSFALFEQRTLDRQMGRMMNANLEMYKIATIADMPRIEPVLWKQDGAPPMPLGEPPTIPTAGAIACAVLNAIGAPVRHLPLTPDKVLAALAAGGAA